MAWFAQGVPVYTFGVITLLAAVLLLAAGIKIIFSSVLRYNPSSFGLLLAAVLWLTGMAGTYLWPTEQARLGAMVLQYVAIAWLAPFLIGLASGFGQGPSAWRNRLFTGACLVSLCMTALVLELPFKGLIIVSPSFDPVSGVLVKQTGALYPVYVLYQAFVAMLSLGIILKRSISMVREEQERARILVGAFLPPIVVAIADAAGLRPVPGQNLTTYSLILSAAVLFWGMYRAKLLSPVFLAKDDLVDTMAEPVIVSQRSGQILFANQKARELSEKAGPGNHSFAFLGDCHHHASTGNTPLIQVQESHWKLHSHFVTPAKPQDSAIVTVLHDVSAMAAQAKELEGLVQERTSQLSNLVREKEELLHELHHRVKNNLQIIISLIKLQANRITPDTDIQQVCMAMVDRIKSISLVHDRMNRQGTMDGIDFGTYLEDLVKNIASLYENLAPQPVIAIPKGSWKADLDFCVDFGLVVNELMTNAYKYAVPKSMKALEITLTLSPEKLVLVLRDHGPGLQHPGQIRQGSLGLNVVRSILHKYHSALQSGMDGGAWVSITVPMPVIGLSWSGREKENPGGTGNSGS